MHARTLGLLRGWSAAFAATAVAASAHVLAGGAIGTPAILLLSLALSGLVSCAVAGRSLSLPRLTAAVAASQGVFHLLFSVGGAGAYAPGAGQQAAVPGPGSAALAAAGSGGSMDLLETAAGRGGHAHHAASFAAASGDIPSGLPAGGALMWAGHLAAALITIVLIRHGEATARRLAEAVRLRITAYLPLFHQPAVRYVRVPVLTDFLSPLHRLGAPLRAMRHRGPPLPA